jgi:hypothetical protein
MLLRAAFRALCLALWLFACDARASTPEVQSPGGVIAGVITDDTGAPIAGATVTLAADGAAPGLEVPTGEDGRFSLSNVPAGPFQLRVSASGFVKQTVSGVAAAGAVATLPPIRLKLAATAVSVDVTPTRHELAEQQIKEQVQQRVFGVIPNFYVVYTPDAVPLSLRQKAKLSWKARVDPVQFGVVAMVAGAQHARDDFSGFGRGPSGYAKRYAAAYATVVTRSAIMQILMPSVFKQDPRYFYKGTGSTGARVSYALSRAVVRKGDNGTWQPNYSGILGSLASGAVSNLYYPAEDRRGARLMFQNTAIGIGAGALGYVAQEFLFSKVTSRARKSEGKK